MGTNTGRYRGPTEGLQGPTPLASSLSLWHEALGMSTRKHLAQPGQPDGGNVVIANGSAKGLRICCTHQFLENG